MKKSGILNSEVASVVAGMGHMDWLSIGDAGMPVPMGTKKIDLCVDKELPTFMQVLENVLTEMKVQKIYLADEIKDQNPEQLENIRKALPNVEVEFMPHTDLKKNLVKTHAFIRTGEMTPYSNIILESGVTF
ncbi:MAG: D-ribose pyranase [Limosilactobacillus gorillae]|jgi:D-ribose pyranase|uniref:D-ribose pyranase n=1 Tax=Limosilactobacillus gorillae TaxID=1450649 RepID=UPI000AA7E49A|nr:D-ribose pyranase [Limosilactobacillus gorillae]MDO4856276.1 D-ribose pyranase [Limosilactobacillus gorillae]